MLPPRIDNRTLPDLIERMKEMVPHYTPEWRFSPDDPDPGTALFLIFAEMFLQNVERLNKVPMNNKLAFLNMIDVSQLSARPAQGYVTFQLNNGAKQPVFVKQGTQVTATPPDAKDPIIFETDSAFMLTPATLADAYQISARQDSIQRVGDRFVKKVDPGEAQQPVALFAFQEGENLQEHALYLGHPTLFLLKGSAVIEVDLFHSMARYKQNTYGERLANLQAVEWLYGTQDGWQRFDEVSYEDNRVILKKKQPIEIISQKVNGIQNRWICCRIKPTKLDAISPDSDELLIDGLQTKADYLDDGANGGIVPEMIFHNDMQLDPAGFYPFGEFFYPMTTFYLSDEEVLSKRDSTITMNFQIKTVRNRRLKDDGPPIDWKLIMKQKDLERPQVLDASILNVLWEYWNGKSWVRLFSNKEYEEIFYGPIEDVAIEKTITFQCPSDLKQTYVNGHNSYWIRARVLQVENMYANNPYYLSPYLASIRLRYNYGADRFPVEECLTRNNLETLGRTANVTYAPKLFAPFASLDVKHPALYLGFNTAPVKGPIQAYFSLQQQKYTDVQMPVVEWQYLRNNGEQTEWATLKVNDGTNALTRSGLIQFVGPSDFAKGSQFQQELYWIRIVNRDDKWERLTTLYQPLPVINGIYLNTTQVTQQESITGEHPQNDPSNSDGFVTAKSPVYAEYVWVDETGSLTEQQITALVKHDKGATNIIRTPDGKILRLWIRWHSVSHFDDSGPDDRHYIMDRSTGKLRFGDGKQGKKPPNKGQDKILIDYKVIAGERGNVEARMINTMRQAVPFVNAVFNPEPLGGGCDIEPVERAVERGPQMIKHRNKAVTASDYEWLTRQVNQDIAKVKCLPNTNVNIEWENGVVTLVVLPKGGQGALHGFTQVKEQVEAALTARSAATVGFAGNVQVIEPAFLEISIFAHLIVKRMDLVMPTETAAREQLDRFLDPLTGNYDGNGWEIGQPIHQSVFYALLKSIKGVNFIEKLSMTIVKVEDGKRVELPTNHVPTFPHGIVVNGKHQVVVDI